MRILTEEMLRNFLDQNPEITSMDMLSRCLDEQSKRSKTTKVWHDKECFFLSWQPLFEGNMNMNLPFSWHL